jgi:hypothetical protein
VAADGPSDHAWVPEVVEPALFSVALPGSEQQGQVLRLAGREETPFQGRGEMLGEADPDEAPSGNGVARQDRLDGLLDADHLVARHHTPSGPTTTLSRPSSRRRSATRPR